MNADPIFYYNNKIILETEKRNLQHRGTGK